jgi:ethanolamine utilization cobalamin adenosyltransferase
MNLITEDVIKKIINSGAGIYDGELTLPTNSVLTPSAKSVVSDKKLKIKFSDEVETRNPEKVSASVMDTAAKMAAKTIGKFKLEYGGYLDEKPEHMTQLYGNLLVNKDHKRIKFRGEIDLLMSEIMKVQVRAHQLELKGLTDDLEDVCKLIRQMSRCEVLEEPLGHYLILGLSQKEIRDMSHNPKKYFNHEHLFNVTFEIGEVPVLLNFLRASIRKVEVACYEAFKQADGNISRGDLMEGYNRLSSVMYIITFKYLSNSYK